MEVLTLTSKQFKFDLVTVQEETTSESNEISKYTEKQWEMVQKQDWWNKPSSFY